MTIICCIETFSLLQISILARRAQHKWGCHNCKYVFVFTAHMDFIDAHVEKQMVFKKNKLEWGLSYH